MCTLLGEEHCEAIECKVWTNGVHLSTSHIARTYTLTHARTYALTHAHTYTLTHAHTYTCVLCARHMPLGGPGEILPAGFKI